MAAGIQARLKSSEIRGGRVAEALELNGGTDSADNEEKTESVHFAFKAT